MADRNTPEERRVSICTKDTKTQGHSPVFYLSLFFIGALGYYGLELLFRSHSHWTMALCGGICLVSIALINSHLSHLMLPLRAALSAILISTVELLVGIFDNIIMKWNVWDYSELPLNFLGQICLSFSLCWYLLSIPICLILSRIKK